MKTLQIDEREIDALRLEGAADVLREHGWHRGCEKKDEKFCILEAMAFIDNKSHWLLVDFPEELQEACMKRFYIAPRGLSRAAKVALKHIREHFATNGEDRSAIFNFNDYRCVSRKEAIEVLLEAAQSCRKRKV